jgi:hypothetical protein
METVLISTEYVLVIDTDKLSYDFYKPLCAYCTGTVDEDDEGLECSDLYYLEMGIEDDESPKGSVADEKNPFYGFVGQRKDEDDAYSPCSVWLNKRYGYSATGEYALLTEQNYDEFNFPAPMSVGIFFDVEPKPEHIQTIKSRAADFFKKIWPKLQDGSAPVTIEGFRLIKHTKYGEETDL